MTGNGRLAIQACQKTLNGEIEIYETFADNEISRTDASLRCLNDGSEAGYAKKQTRVGRVGWKNGRKGIIFLCFLCVHCSQDWEL